MNQPQARAVIGLLAAAFPREPMPESTVIVWANALAGLDYEAAKDAASDLALSLDRMPSLHQLINATRTLERDRVPSLPPGDGPTFGEWLADNPDMRTRLEGIGAGGPPATRREVLSKPAIDPYIKLRRDCADLDKPQSTHPRKRSECDHEFYLRDRCFYCGVEGVLA